MRRKAPTSTDQRHVPVLQRGRRRADPGREQPLLSSGQDQPSLPPGKTQLGSKMGLFLWFKVMDGSTQHMEELGRAKGKHGFPLLLSCTSIQPCPGSGCSSWGARHQIPPQNPAHLSPPSGCSCRKSRIPPGRALPGLQERTGSPAVPPGNPRTPTSALKPPVLQVTMLGRSPAHSYLTFVLPFQ